MANQNQHDKAYVFNDLVTANQNQHYKAYIFNDLVTANQKQCYKVCAVESNISFHFSGERTFRRRWKRRIKEDKDTLKYNRWRTSYRKGIWLHIKKRNSANLKTKQIL